MRLLATLSALLLLAHSASAAPAIKGDLKYEPHTLVRLQADGIPAKAGIKWRVYPATGVQRATTTQDRLEFAAHPGTYEVELLAISVGADGAVTIDEAAVTVVVKSCLPPPMPPNPNPNPKPNPPNPGGGTLDPSNAIGRIQFGNAGCSATVIAPRLPDGRWRVLTAAHCIGGQGQKGTMRMPKSGKTYGVTVHKYDRECDLCWLITDSSIDDIEYANLSPGNPPVGTAVWHQGYGFHLPRNREDGVVTGGENSSGQLRFTLNVSSGDSGGGIFRADTNEVISAVCCTAGIAVKTSMWGGSTAQARRLMPTSAGEDTSENSVTEQTDWKPLPLPIRSDPSASAEPRQDEWTPVAMPIKQDETATAPAPAPCIVTRPQTLVGWPGQQMPVIYPQQGWRVYP